MDLKEHLDEVAHAGPDHPPVAARLAEGQRALRRRRAAVAGVLAGVVAVGGAAWTAVPDEPAVVATAGAPSPQPSPARVAWPSEDSWAAIDADGTVSLRPGVEVLQRFDDVADGMPSVALDLERGEEHRFVLLWVAGNGVTSEITEPAVGALNEFVVRSQDVIDGGLPMAVGTGGDYASLPLVAYRNGSLYVVPGATIVRAVPHPIQGWCGTWPSHAVEISYEGSRYFAALTEGNCGSSFGGAGAGRTLEDFITDFASTQP